jgi:hypothetical protein
MRSSDAEARVRYAVVAGFVIAGCNNLPNEALYRATRPTVDPYCKAALDHAGECDPRFPDRITLCTYSAGGECAPYINAAQSQCIRESSCEAVRAALDRRDWLCGLQLTPPMGRE